MLLTDEELWALAPNADNLESARAIESAILAKLASEELPEPSILKDEELGDFSLVENHYTETSMRLSQAQAYAQGYAQGAAAQLAHEPECWMQNTGAGLYVDYNESEYHTVPLYTRREAK